MIQYHYHRFWSGFQGDAEPWVQRFLRPMTEPLVKELEKRGPNGAIHIVSVFPTHPPMVRDPALRNQEFWIAYSGEPHHLDIDSGIYDVHFIMKPESLEQKILSVPLFVIYLHNHLYRKTITLEQLASPRIYRSDAKTHFAAMTVRNGLSQDRNRIIRRLMERKVPIDSYGGHYHNTGNRWLKEGEEYNPNGPLHPYRFILCFENTFISDNMTEKLLHAYMAGAVPVYAGSTIARSYLNPNAFLYWDPSVESEDAFIDRWVALNNDEEAYRSIYEQPLFRDASIPEKMSVPYYQKRLEEMCLI
jgi:Glycosyltransferase family 10 (fucosyltransferase) C-term